jgi:hypothetical protein
MPPPEPPEEPAPEGSNPPTVGPLALEAALLLDVVADRLTSIKDGAAPANKNPPTSEGGDRGQQTSGTQSVDARCPECGSVPGASCTACPLCRFMSLLRGERPEATARLVDGALMIIRTLRSLVPDPPDLRAPQPNAGSDQTSGQQGSGQGPGHQHPPHPTPGRHGGLEHIDIL